MRGAGKKLIYGVGISDSGEFARSYKTESGKYPMTEEYEVWTGVLERCYSENFHRKNPTYQGCTMSASFKYFQYFADWCRRQVGFNIEGFQIDKDILLKGNKEYSEINCVFVPRNINMLFRSSKTLRGDLPLGVCKDGSTYRGSMSSGTTGQQIHLGNFKTPELAFQAYKIAKETKAKELAIQYEGLVDPRVIVALNNYVVNIDD